MAVRGCAFCGYQIRYHGEPEGTEPVQYIFCTLDNGVSLKRKICPPIAWNWNTKNFFYAWRCLRCGTFTFFLDRIHVSEIYTPNEKFSSEPMKKPFEFGPFWDDFQWFDITEDDIHASGNSDAFKLSTS